jgi:ABC-type nitrate/sulfonate/bicarbonate transport system permease component
MRRLSQLTPVAVAALLLAVWEFGVRAAAVPQFILPAPSVIAVRFAEAWADGTMLRHLVPNVTEVTVGGLLGGALGLLIGVTLGLSGSARRVVSPYLVAAQSTPILALGPVLVLWLGPGLAAKVAVCALITLFPVAISTLVAIRDVDPGTLELMRSLGATRWQMVRRALLPAAAPGILTGIVLAVGRAVGETAPLILIGAVTFVTFVPVNPFEDKYTVLPIQIFNWAGRPQAAFQEISAAAILVLLVLMFLLNLVAVILRARLSRTIQW